MSWEANCGCFKKLFLILIMTCVLFLAILSYSSRLFADRPDRRSFWTKQVINQTLSRSYSHSDFAGRFLKTKDKDTFGPVNFDINGSDVIVFLHMQKTGGTTFGQHLISNLNLTKECDILERRKRRNCLRPNSDVETWLFSRYSTGWACGLHSDWTELKECVSDKLSAIENVHKQRRFFYITILRDPVNRFYSELLHTRRGATWSASTHSCRGNRNNIPKCYSGEDWRGVQLEEFMSCPYNLAINRQTRMIADLRVVNCYEKWLNSNLSKSDIMQLESKLLESAKKNLKEMTFFGLLEQQKNLQKLFEYTFPFKFKKDFEQFNITRITSSYPSEEQVRKIKKLNYLDIDLYDYATKLFEKRFKKSFSTA